jgi:TRAP-type mannitol/chloroaromatic compound transport system substrate-binding protein
MAKKSMIARETKRAKLVAKYAAKREALKTIVSSVTASEGEIWQWANLSNLERYTERVPDALGFAPLVSSKLDTQMSAS